jgi:hypothetical protein
MSPILGIYASQLSGHLGAPTGVYESIATTTLASTTASVTFSSISSAYTHLQIRCIARDSSTPGTLDLQFNGDTGSNYARHALYGDGASAAAAGSATQTYMRAGDIATSGSTANVFGAYVIDILDYTSTNKNKTMRALGGFDNNGSGTINLRSSLWYATPAAITSITLFITSSSFAANSSFALYGIK